MSTWKWILAALAVFLGAAYWGLAIKDHYQYRYRLTLEIETPNGLKTGSSVLEVRMSEHVRFLPDMPVVGARLLGEAVVVDLGQGRNLVALLGGGPTGSEEDWMVRVPIMAFHLTGLSWKEKAVALTGPYRGTRAELSREMLPTLVTFSDIADPKTARIVALDELVQVFGPDVRIHGAWIEMTKDRVTRGIELRLPCLVVQREWMRHQPSYPNKFSPHFHFFSRE